MTHIRDDIEELAQQLIDMMILVAQSPEQVAVLRKAAEELRCLSADYAALDEWASRASDDADTYAQQVEQLEAENTDLRSRLVEEHG